MQNRDLIKLNQNNKNWIEEISGNWQKYLNQWILDYKNGILERQDIINIIEKIISYKSSQNMSVKEIMTSSETQLKGIN